MYEYKFKLDRVLDGDTVDVAINLGFDIHVKKRVRLLGINAPETRTRDAAEKVAGYKAKEYLNQMLCAGTDLVVKTKLDKTGKFGRVLGTIYVDGIDVNQHLQKQGLVFPYGTKWKDRHDKSK